MLSFQNRPKVNRELMRFNHMYILQFDWTVLFFNSLQEHVLIHVRGTQESKFASQRDEALACYYFPVSCGDFSSNK